MDFAVFALDRDLPEVFVAANVLTQRALAFVAGILVFFEALRIIRGVVTAKIDPKGNAIGWAMVSLAAVGGAGTFLIVGEGRVTMTGWSVELGALWVWTLIAWSLVWMMARQSPRPAYIITSAVMFSLSGVALTLIEGSRIGVI